MVSKSTVLKVNGPAKVNGPSKSERSKVSNLKVYGSESGRSKKMKIDAS